MEMKGRYGPPPSYNDPFCNMQSGDGISEFSAIDFLLRKSPEYYVIFICDEETIIVIL